jgi:hypothetical protein
LAVLFHESAGLFVVVGLTAVALLPERPTPTPSLKGRENMPIPALPKKDTEPHPNPLLGKEREADGAAPTHPAKPTRLRLACAFIASWAAIAGLGYLIVGGLVLGLHSPHAFHAWSAEYSELGWWWNFDIPNNLHSDVVALRRAAFVQPPGSHGTLHLSANTPTGLLALYLATLVGWFAAVYYFCVALPLLWRTHHRPIVAISLVWIVLYAGFFTVWSPGEYIFWVPALVPISLLLALTMAHFRSQRAGVLVNWLVGAWVLMYGCVNLVVDIGPHLQPLANPCERIAIEYRAHTKPGDLVLLAGAGDLARLEVDIPYFADRDCMSVHTTLARARDNVEVASHVLQANIAKTLASGHAVYVCDDLWHAGLHPDVAQELEKHHPGVNIAQIPSIFRPWSAERAWSSSHGPVWRLESPP